MVLFDPFQVLAFAMVLQVLVVLARVTANGVTTLAVGNQPATDVLVFLGDGRSISAIGTQVEEVGSFYSRRRRKRGRSRREGITK